MIKFAIVSPCYNEEAILDTSAKKLSSLLVNLIEKKKISSDSFILFVNDGSKDSTWEIIERLHFTNTHIKGLCLARNVGHQYAIMAGMMTARTMCDGLVTIDADLQDDITCIERMIDEYNAGSDVIYGVKVSRKADSPLKKWSAETFYKLMQALGVETIFNHADFRFLSRRVLDALSKYTERNLYLRALIPQIGFPSTTIADRINAREAGHSKYTLSKMLKLAIDGITSFTEKPLYYIIGVGVAFVMLSILVAIYVMISLILGHAVAGWTSLMLSLWFISGILLIALGIVGLYVGKIFREVKARPIYNIKDFLE